ncbi:hypothetical protein D3C76_1540590 [compost metagenome]
MWRQTNTRPVGAAAFVGTAEAGGGCPGGGNQHRYRQARGQDPRFEIGNILIVDQLMIDRRDRILPNQLFGRHFRTEIASARPHIAVGQFVPGASEGVGKLIGMFIETA